MTVFGYVRENYPEPTDQQIMKISQHSCDVIYIEEDGQRQEKREMMLKEIKAKDVIVVADIRVFSLGIKELGVFNQELMSKDIQLISLNDKIDTDCEMSFFESFQLFIKIDSEQRSYQTKMRLAIAKAEGKQLGRPTINLQKIDRIRSLSDSMLTMREIADQCKVSLGTVHKYVNQHELIQNEKRRVEHENRLYDQ